MPEAQYRNHQEKQAWFLTVSAWIVSRVERFDTVRNLSQAKDLCNCGQHRRVSPSYVTSIEMRQFAEDLKPLFNLISGECAKALGAKLLDHKRPHNASVEHRSLQDLAVDFRL